MEELSEDFIKFCSQIHGVSDNAEETGKAAKSTEIRHLYLREKPPPIDIDPAAKVTVKAKETSNSKEKKKPKKTKESKKGKQNPTKKNVQELKKIQSVNSPSSKDGELQENAQSDEVDITYIKQHELGDCMQESTIMQNYGDIDISQEDFFKDNIKFIRDSVENKVEISGAFSDLDLERQFLQLSCTGSKIVQSHFNLMEADENENVDAFSNFTGQAKTYATVLKSNLQKEKSKSTDALLKPIPFKKIGK